MATATYEQLLAETMPTRIDSEEQYEAISLRFGELLAKPFRTDAEDKLMDLLGVLIQDYDRRNSLPPDNSSPAERLEFLMDHSEKTPDDLLPIFGRQHRLHEVLAGEQPINADEARKLGRLFSVDPGLFI